MSSKTLLIITATGCSACTRLKSDARKYEEIKAAYRSRGIDIREINASSTSGLPTNHPEVLASLVVRWFPMFVLVDTALLQMSRRELNAQVLANGTRAFNGTFTNGHYERSTQRRDVGNPQHHVEFITGSVSMTTVQAPATVQRQSQSRSNRPEVCDTFRPQNLYSNGSHDYTSSHLGR